MDILKVLKEKDFHFSKRYGQNFITDSNLLNAIVADAGITKADTVLEIGAGAGTLTAAIAAKAGRVVSYEIDENLRSVLASTLSGIDNVELVFGDVLKADMRELNKNLGEYKIVANLPYYITTPIIFNFLFEKEVKDITIMVQKEVAERICAKAGTAEYGALSVGVQAYGEARIVRQVNRRLFTPSPDVDSSIVNIVLGSKVDSQLSPVLRRTITAAFAMRRKTLVNNLMAGFSFSRLESEGILKELGVSEKVRGEALDVGEFISLAQIIYLRTKKQV